MASGFGLNGGVGRCYPFFHDLQVCLEGAENPRECVPVRDDYLECLHHRKEFERRARVATEFKKKGGVPTEDAAPAEAAAGDAKESSS